MVVMKDEGWIGANGRIYGTSGAAMESFLHRRSEPEADDEKKSELPDFSLKAIIKLDQRVAHGHVISLVEPAFDGLMRALIRQPDLLYTIDPYKLEELCAASFKKAGFDEVILTPRSGDRGRDVIAKKSGIGSIKIIEQVKAYKPGHLVTAEEVRALLAPLYGEQDVSKALFRRRRALRRT